MLQLFDCLSDLPPDPRSVLISALAERVCSPDSLLLRPVTMLADDQLCCPKDIQLSSHLAMVQQDRFAGMRRPSTRCRLAISEKTCNDFPFGWRIGGHLDPNASVCACLLRTWRLRHHIGVRARARPLDREIYRSRCAEVGAASRLAQNAERRHARQVGLAGRSLLIS